MAANATDFAKVAALDGQLKELQDERSVLEDEWLKLAELLSEA
jgi:ABC transport system ATP-binding/permease protein